MSAEDHSGLHYIAAKRKTAVWAFFPCGASLVMAGYHPTVHLRMHDYGKDVITGDYISIFEIDNVKHENRFRVPSDGRPTMGNDRREADEAFLESLDIDTESLQWS